MSMVNQDWWQETLSALDEQDIVSVCTVCTAKVVVLPCEHGGTVVYSLDGTSPHPCIREDATGRHPVPTRTFVGAYAGYSGEELLAEAQRLDLDDC